MKTSTLTKLVLSAALIGNVTVSSAYAESFPGPVQTIDPRCAIEAQEQIMERALAAACSEVLAADSQDAGSLSTSAEDIGCPGPVPTVVPTPRPTIDPCPELTCEDHLAVAETALAKSQGQYLNCMAAEARCEQDAAALTKLFNADEALIAQLKADGNIQRLCRPVIVTEQVCKRIKVPCSVAQSAQNAAPQLKSALPSNSCTRLSCVDVEKKANSPFYNKFTRLCKATRVPVSNKAGKNAAQKQAN